MVMEEDDSGLRLVNTIREVIGNAEMRIVLLRGNLVLHQRAVS